MQEKLMDLSEAVASLVKDGDSIVLGAALENAIPFAATHELIRQGFTGLNMVAPISDISTDMLIGAGCCNEITGAWVGNVSAGLGHNYRRATEKGIPHRVKVYDYSNCVLGLALFGGGSAWLGAAQLDSTRLGLARLDSARLGLGSAWLGLA